MLASSQPPTIYVSLPLLLYLCQMIVDYASLFDYFHSLYITPTDNNPESLLNKSFLNLVYLVNKVFIISLLFILSFYVQFSLSNDQIHFGGVWWLPCDTSRCCDTSP